MKRAKTSCETCANYIYDDITDTYFCDMNLDEDEMEYRAEMDDNLQGTEDDGIYSIETLIREGDDGPEPDRSINPDR